MPKIKRERERVKNSLSENVNPVGNSSGMFGFVLAVFLAAGLLSFATAVFASSTSGAINSTNRYAWSENAGWLDFGGSYGSVTVTDSALSGYAYGETVGWVSLNCANDSSCATVDYKVANNGEGTLTGYAQGENAGWIKFNPDNGGVTIDSSGNFSGYAYGENIGWIVFNCSTTSSCETVDYKVPTDWRPRSARPACNNSSDDGDGIYTATIQAPLVHGEYEVISIIEYKNSAYGKKELRLTAVVDPEGYIYEKNGNKETRIPDAKVSLFWNNPKTGKFELWPAKQYQQVNPQKTDKSGTYSFLVPEGTYKLTVSVAGYYDFTGKEFDVNEGRGVHENIPLRGKSWWKSFLGLFW